METEQKPNLSLTPLPLEVHGDSPERPPMIYGSDGDAIVSQMPDGTPYFEPDEANRIVRAVNSHDGMLRALKACHKRLADNGLIASHSRLLEPTVESPTALELIEAAIAEAEQ